MKKKRYRFGLFTETESIADQVQQIAPEFSIDLVISRNSLDNAIADAQRMESGDVELILTGMETGAFLIEHVNIPVITFTLPFTDISASISRAAEQANRILIPRYGEEGDIVRTVTEFLGVEIESFRYRNAQGVLDGLERARADGIELVLGGGYITRCARQIGLQAFDYLRSDESIRDAVRHALSICQANREGQEKYQRYSAILNAASDGLLAVDVREQITAINRQARNLLGLNDVEVVGTPLNQYIQTSKISRALSQNSLIVDSIEKTKDKTFVWNHQPYEVDGEVAGCVSSFNEIASVMRSENKIRRSLSRGHVARYTIDDLLHQSEVMRQTVAEARQYAMAGSNLLVTGETGTGKELLVQGIHNLSERRRYPFVSINCAALPDQLLESELFGYEEGAFTGSRKGGRTGLFELAHKGTIFLDEIGETSEYVQLRLLRVLQEREIMRLGGDRLVPIDVRVIAASNRDLSTEVRLGNFRDDLFFRLNILRIHIPPLRSRPDDIPLLLRTFLGLHAENNGLAVFEIPGPQLAQLKKHPWPGNVRQLRNFAERLVLLSQSEFNPQVFEKVLGELQAHYTATRGPQPVSATLDEQNDYVPIVAKTLSSAQAGSLEERIARRQLESERELLMMALEGAGYSRNKAAEALGVSRSTLWKKLKRAGLKIPQSAFT